MRGSDSVGWRVVRSISLGVSRRRDLPTATGSAAHRRRPAPKLLAQRDARRSARNLAASACIIDRKYSNPIPMAIISDGSREGSDTDARVARSPSGRGAAVRASYRRGPARRTRTHRRRRGSIVERSPPGRACWAGAGAKQQPGGAHRRAPRGGLPGDALVELEGRGGWSSGSGRDRARCRRPPTAAGPGRVRPLCSCWHPI